LVGAVHQWGGQPHHTSLNCRRTKQPAGCVKQNGVRDRGQRVDTLSGLGVGVDAKKNAKWGFSAGHIRGTGWEKKKTKKQLKKNAEPARN